MTNPGEGHAIETWKLVLASDEDMYTMWSEAYAEKGIAGEELLTIATSQVNMSRSMSDSGQVKLWTLVNDYNIPSSFATAITVNAFSRSHDNDEGVAPSHVCRLVDIFTRPVYRGQGHAKTLLKTLPYCMGYTDYLPPPSNRVVWADLAPEDWNTISPAIMSTLWTDINPSFYQRMSIGHGRNERHGWVMSENLNSAWVIDMAQAKTLTKDDKMAIRYISWPQLLRLSTDLSGQLASSLHALSVQPGDVTVAVDPAELPRLTQLRTMFDRGAPVTLNELYGDSYGIYLENIDEQPQDGSIAHKPFALIQENYSPDERSDVLISMMGNVTEEHVSTLLRAVSEYSAIRFNNRPGRIVLWGSLSHSVAASWRALGGRFVDRLSSSNYWRVGTSSWGGAGTRFRWHDEQDQAWSFLP